MVADTEHVALATQNAESGIVLAKDVTTECANPARSSTPQHLLAHVCTFVRTSALVWHVSYLRSRSQQVESDVVISDDPGTGFTRALEKARSADIVIVSNYVNVTSETATASVASAFADFVAELTRARSGNGLVVVTFGTPYLLQQIPDAPAYMIAWEVTLLHSAQQQVRYWRDRHHRDSAVLSRHCSIGVGERRSRSLTP